MPIRGNKNTKLQVEEKKLSSITFTSLTFKKEFNLDML